jgi:hypothetical protein
VAAFEVRDDLLELLTVGETLLHLGTERRPVVRRVRRRFLVGGAALSPFDQRSDHAMMLAPKPARRQPDSHESGRKVPAAVSDLEALAGVLPAEPDANVEPERHTLRRAASGVQADGAHLLAVVEGSGMGRAHASSVP